MMQLRIPLCSRERIPRYYRNVSGLFITCGGGGNNSYRSLRFTLLLQGLANELGMKIVISHYSPGKSMYNKYLESKFIM